MPQRRRASTPKQRAGEPAAELVVGLASLRPVLGEDCKNCVRSVRNRREIQAFTESHRCASCAANSLKRLRHEVFRWCSMLLASFAFQACSFNVPMIRPRQCLRPGGASAGATVAVRLRKGKLGPKRNGSGDRCTTAALHQHDIGTAVRSTEWVGDFSHLKSTAWRWWT